ncbi:MAG: hypothetical protein ACRDRH_08830 [Pseudonocardia sp.]
MLVLLPPSETKRVGGDGPPLDLDALSHTELGPALRRLSAAGPGEPGGPLEAAAGTRARRNRGW